MRRAVQIFAATLLTVGFGPVSGHTDGSVLAFGYDEWRAEVRDKGLSPDDVVFPFTASPAMVAWAEQAVGGGGSLGEIQRLVRVQDAMFQSGKFEFSYDGHKTLTAQQAFDLQQGNCISFTALFVSLTRSIGIPTRLMSVEGTPQVRRDGNLVVINRHVVAAFSSGNDVAIFDFDLSSEDELIGRRIIDDVEASAMFHNNLGGAALRDGDPSGALDHFRITTTLWAEWPVGWVNLGVSLSHIGDEDRALEAYNRALQVDPGNSSALMNMAHVYLKLGRKDEARTARLAAAETSENPFALVAMADSELVRGNLDEASRYLGRARRLYGAEPEVFEGLARLAESLGNPRQADKYKRKADRLRTTRLRDAGEPVPSID